MKTSDLGLASYLVARGYQLITVERNDRANFVFPPDAAHDAPAYYRGAQVSAYDMAQALRSNKIAIRHAFPR